MDTSFAIIVTEDDSFSQTETAAIIEEFVCGVCHGELHDVYIPNEARVLIVCFEHGNICDCGRVTRNTVSIELERSYKTYYAAIHALQDLWPELLEQGFERDHATRIARSNVCEVCGGGLTTTYGKRQYDVVCAQHGSVSICGYISREKFIYNYQAIRVWEKNHPRPRTWEITKEK